MKLETPHRVMWFDAQGRRMRGTALAVRPRFFLFGEMMYVVRHGRRETSVVPKERCQGKRMPEPRRKSLWSRLTRPTAPY